MNPIGGIGQGFPLASLRPELPVRRNGDISGAPQEPGSDSISMPAVGGGGAFDNVLGRFVQQVNEKQLAAGDAVQGLLSGRNVPLHQAMLAAEEASVSFQLMVEVRNKLLEGYQEIMRMQI